MQDIWLFDSNRLIMIPFKKKFRTYLISLTHWAEKWRWVLIGVIGLAIFWAEYREYATESLLVRPLTIVEIILSSILIAVTGLIVELFVRSNEAYKQMLKVLEYKHKLSLDLTLNNNWETLITMLGELPAFIANVDETYFLMKNPISGKLDKAGHWIRKGRVAELKWDPTIPCQKCIINATSPKNNFHLCNNGIDESLGHVYSLEIINANLPAAVLKFKLGPGLLLSDNEEEIFNNIQDEIAVALYASRVQKRLSELQFAEVAMAERRMVSAYVHDQLGQNLGYLHLKLDQLVTNEIMVNSKDIRKELKQLREVANDSYEIVRDILKKMQPDSIPNLTNLLKEHATRVSRMAKINLKFNCTGDPIPLSPDMQRSIFYIFSEILSNVEKHSKANTMDVLIAWNNSFLDISVADNGVGFDPKLVQKEEHFGLEILQERIVNLKGRMTMNPSPNSGTVISISVPV